LPLSQVSQLNLQGHEIALVVDAGGIAPTQPSTHVEIDLSQTRLLREGAISQSGIKKVIPALVIA
jgi:tRNA A37 threonylcarbamoyladenosine synthetase subunit TsaC/SUA5/YrdC